MEENNEAPLANNNLTAHEFHTHAEALLASPI